MARKIAGYYNEEYVSGTEAGQLFVEISNNGIACLVKGETSQQIEGFELFELNKGSNDWNDVFYEIRATSQLLSKQYTNTHCYYNFEDAILIPAKCFTAASAEDYLSLMYGETSRYEIKFDTLSNGAGMVNAYRVRRSINELMSRHFVLYKPHHSYSSLLEDIFSRTELDDHFMKAQFYSNHMIVAVVKNKQLQLIQSFQFTAKEDVLYHLINTSQQFVFNSLHSHLEISGMFETGSALHIQLQALFGLITFDGMKPDGVFALSNEFPSHYFTPFYKLVV